jgi:hypothetical protein
VKNILTKAEAIAKKFGITEAQIAREADIIATYDQQLGRVRTREWHGFVAIDCLLKRKGVNIDDILLQEERLDSW